MHVSLNGTTLREGNGAAVGEEGPLGLLGVSTAQVLVFDLA